MGGLVRPSQWLSCSSRACGRRAIHWMAAFVALSTGLAFATRSSKAVSIPDIRAYLSDSFKTGKNPSFYLQPMLTRRDLLAGFAAVSFFPLAKGAFQTMDQRVSLVTLGVKDLGTSKRFYVNGFGWKPVFENKG